MTHASTTPPSSPPASSADLRSAPLANLASTLPILLVLGFYLVVALRVQLQVPDAAAAFGAILATQIVPGALVWRAIRPRDGWLLEDLVVGFALGSALAVPAQIVAGLSRVTALSWIVPVAVGLLLILVPGTRRRITEARWVGIPWWLSTVIAVASLTPITQFRDYIAANRLQWNAYGRPHLDAYLHQALASELLHRGPVAWPTVLGEDLGYHWFTHAWLAQVTAVSGTDLDIVLLRVMPLAMPVAMALAVGMAALRLFRSGWVAAVAVGLTMAVGSADVFGYARLAIPVNPDSPTLALGGPTLLALITILALRWRGEARSGAFWIVPLLAIVAAGTKGSTVPLVVAGLAAAFVATLLWQRSLALKVLLDLLVVGASLVAVMIVVFHGSSAGLAFGIPEAAAQTPLARTLAIETPTGSVLLITLAATFLAAFARGAVALVLPLDPQARRDPLSWLLLGGAAAGAGAVTALSHPGLSQYYFVATAIPVAALGSAYGLQVLARRLGTARFLAVLGVGSAIGVAMLLVPQEVLGTPAKDGVLKPWVLLALGLAAAAALLGLLIARKARLTGAVAGVTIAVLALGATGFAQGFRTTVRPFKPVPDLGWPDAVSQGQIDTARWIRDHSDVDDVVMTNRHCRIPRIPFGDCDSRRWLVTAFSERQSLVEGWTATPKATRVAPHGRDSITVDYWKPDILHLNDDFYTAPTAAAQRRLWDLGVRWIYLENTMPHASTLEPYALQRFATKDASAWELLPPQ